MKTILGHEAEIKLLKKLHEGDNLGHAYIFYGPDNIGKTTVARGFANFLETGKFEISEKPLQDSHMFSPKKGIIGIDQMRELKTYLSMKPIISKRKTIIIESANLLNTEAQNALLKSAEEPPKDSLLIMTLQNPEALIPTLNSRFQNIYFGEPSEKKITTFFEEENKKEFKEAVEMFGSKVGLIFEYFENENFRDEILKVKKYLSASSIKKDELAKEMLDDEEFNLNTFIKLAILLLAKQATNKQNVENWHKIMELFKNLEYYNLNQKIQLKYLNQILSTWKNT